MPTDFILILDKALSHKIVDKTHFIYCAIVRYLQILDIPMTNKVTPCLKFTNAFSCLHLKRVLSFDLNIFISV